jgi:hypothetical protein
MSTPAEVMTLSALALSPGEGKGRFILLGDHVKDWYEITSIGARVLPMFPSKGVEMLGRRFIECASPEGKAVSFARWDSDLVVLRG